MRKYTPRQQVHPEVLSRDVMHQQIASLVQRARSSVNSSGDMQLLLERIGSDDTTVGAQMWAFLRWKEEGRPVYYVEKELAETLSKTEIPFSVFNLKLELPTDGMYVSLPPIFEVENRETGMHDVVGAYIVLDKLAVRVGEDGELDFHVPDVVEERTVVDVRDEGFRLIEGITVVGVGRAKNVFKIGGAQFLNDAIISAHFAAGQPITEHLKSTFGGYSSLVRTTLNLLYAMQNTRSVVQERAVPELSKKALKRGEAKALKELEAEGRTVRPYTILSLSRTVRTVQPGTRGASSPAGTRKLTGPKFVSGHFHRYWVLDPAGEKVHETKDGVAGTLHLVEYLLAPYIQGEDIVPDPNKPKTVLVRK